MLYLHIKPSRCTFFKRTSSFDVLPSFSVYIPTSNEKHLIREHTGIQEMYLEGDDHASHMKYSINFTTNSLKHKIAQFFFFTFSFSFCKLFRYEEQQTNKN